MAQPTVLPIWAIGPDAQKITEPDTSQKDIGYDDGDFPHIGEFNYLFNTYYQWILYVKEDLAAGSTDNTIQIASVAAVFTYLDINAYLAIGTPDLNDKIDRKVSDAKEVIDAETDAKISAIDVTTVGTITGMDLRVNDNYINILQGGIADMHPSGTTVWDPSQIKRASISVGNFEGRYINPGYTDWDFFADGVGGNMADNVLLFAPGVSVYFFLIERETATPGAPFMMSDTNITGSNAVTTLRSIIGIPGSEKVFLRRIGGTVTITQQHNSNRTAGLEGFGVGDEFFVINAPIGAGPTYTYSGKKIYTDVNGDFISATGDFASAASQGFDFQSDLIGPTFPEGIYHISVYANGSLGSPQTLLPEISESTGSMRKSYAIITGSAYTANNGHLTNTMCFDLDTRNFFGVITNLGSAIDYFDITMRGWTDYRQQFRIE